MWYPKGAVRAQHPEEQMQQLDPDLEIGWVVAAVLLLLFGIALSVWQISPIWMCLGSALALICLGIYMRRG